MSTMGKLTLKVLTPEGLLLEKEGLDAVNVLLADGYPIGIRPGHAPMIAETVKGSVIYRSFNHDNEIQLYAGVLEIREDLIVLLTAGEIEKAPETFDKNDDTEYDRLMQTLIQQIEKHEQGE